MFGITYDVLDELGDISSDTARNFTVLNNNLVSGMQNLYQMVCVLLTALGAGVIALSASKLTVYCPTEGKNEKEMKKVTETDAQLSEILQNLTDKPNDCAEQLPEENSEAPMQDNK